MRRSTGEIAILRPPGRIRFPLMSASTRIGRAHGVRHSLWWEFALLHSFEWQGRSANLAPAEYQHRLQTLVQAFELSDLLDRRVEELTPAERARAELAVALLPQPEVLIWEEPFQAIPPADRDRVVQMVQRIIPSDGLTVMAVGAGVSVLNPRLNGEIAQ